MIRAAIIGITGKMGKALIEATPLSFEIIGISRFCSSNSNFTIKTVPLDTLDVLIDFSSYEALEDNLRVAISHHLPIVIGTTNHNEKAFNLMNLASKTVPVLYSSNFSIGIHLLKSFIKEYSCFLENAFIDITETHHTEKKDLPSGTALDLAHIFNNKHTIFHTPHRRSKEDVVIHSVRVPAHHGAHNIQITLKDETLSLNHSVQDRKVYAHGAFLAAQFLITQKNGFYSFSDVFINKTSLS